MASDHEALGHYASGQPHPMPVGLDPDETCEALPEVAGLHVKVYHPECPAYGAIHHGLTGRRVVYCRTREAMRQALLALRDQADWLQPTPQEDGACQLAMCRALAVEGVRRG